TITEDVLTDTAALQLEMVSENYHDAKIEAIGLTNENGSFVFETEKALTSELFINWLKDHTKKKFMYDAKALKVALLHRGIQIQLAAYLLKPAVNNDEIAIIGKRHGVRDVYLNEEVYGKGAKLKVPELNELAEHIARKTNIVYTLKEQYEEDLQRNAQMELF